MSTIRKYISAVLLACAFVAIPNQAMDAKNLLRHALSSLPSMQNISNFAVQARDTAIENYYIVAPALAIIVIGSCHYLRKCFFGRRTTAVKPTKKQETVSQKISVKPVKKVTDPKKITVAVTSSDTEQASDTGQVTEVEQVAEQEQITPVIQPIDDNNQGSKIIKVINSHDQSLEFNVSSVGDNDDLIHQFSVPSHNSGLIKIN